MKYCTQILWLLGMGLALQTCQNPLKDVELKFIDPLPVVVVLRLNAVGSIPTPVTIKVVGTDASAVVSPLNTTKFVLSGDRLYLSLTASAAPTDENPLRFTVVGMADGYYDVVYSITLTSRAQRLVSVDLLRKKSALLIGESIGRSDAVGVLSTILLAQTPSPNAGSVSSQLIIPVGASLKDGVGTAVPGSINLRMEQLDTRSVAPFAGNGILFQPLTASGRPSPTQQLATIVGGVRILAYNDSYQLVKSFGKPARLTFRLDPQVINPRKNRPIQAGDAISLFSYDAAIGRWQQEPAGAVVRNAQSGLDYVADVTHLSDWVAAFTNPVCEAGPVFTISSPIPPGNLLYHCQVIDVGTDQPIPNTSGNTDFYSTIANGQTIQLYYLPVGSKVKLRVYDSESKAVVTSGVADGCLATSVPLALSSFSTPKNAPAPVTVALQFPCKSLNEAKLPTKAIYAQFRESGTNTWRDLPVLRYMPGKTEFSITTYDVTIGKTYDLQAGASPGYYTVSQSAQLINTAQWIIRIKTKEFCTE